MFPEHYPDSCPPPDAMNPDGTTTFYRVVDAPVSLEDVRSQYELEWPGATTCDDRALSLYKGFRGAKRIIEGYSWAAEKRVARVCPEPEWGLLRTGKRRGSGTHTNLWLYEATDRNAVVATFVLQDEEEDL